MMTVDSAAPAPSSSPPAGWYPDPALPGAERYYDGTAWTEHTRPAAGDVVTKAPSRKGWIIGGSIAAGVVVIGMIAGVAIGVNALRSEPSANAAGVPLKSPPAAELVVVPQLVGMTVADARSEMEAAGLSLYVPDGTDDRAIIATQTFLAGRDVPVGTEVLITVEAAPEPDGSMAAPYPAGYTMMLIDTATDVEVFSLAARPTEAPEGGDVPVEPTTEGTRIVAVDFTVVGLDPAVAELDPGFEAGLWQVADTDGIGYPPLFTQVLTDTPIADGTTWQGRNFYEVPAAVTTPWVLVYESYINLQ